MIGPQFSGNRSIDDSTIRNESGESTLGIKQLCGIKKRKEPSGEFRRVRAIARGQKSSTRFKLGRSLKRIVTGLTEVVALWKSRKRGMKSCGSENEMNPIRHCSEWGSMPQRVFEFPAAGFHTARHIGNELASDQGCTRRRYGRQNLRMGCTSTGARGQLRPRKLFREDLK